MKTRIQSICTLEVLNKEILDECESFSCGDEDMDEFFYNDALNYTRFRMGKSYCFRLIKNPKIIVAFFTVSNDSIRIFDLGSSKKNRMWKEISNREKRLSRYPGILIGRLAISKNYANQGFGSDVVRFVKEWFVDNDNKSGCRLAIVDAKNSKNVISF
ncbi:MAG: N-acetyltransferase, partial [Prevotella sp.]